jgi:DNA gyrase subunit A
MEIEKDKKIDQKIISVNIEDEMTQSYVDYAMSVIVGRALPDVRDGLKPVHRRVLYAMNEMGNTHSKAHKKSARVVGDVMGKYHPHGDMAIYDTIVRMAQPFSLRYCLVDGQGNFGSVDGDAPAAMRYTEIRLSRVAEEFLEDIEKDTVDYGRNYDDTLDEPLVLPSKIPQLLVNGSSGIAVGMATNIPPHNLTEVIDASIKLIKEPTVEDKTLFEIVKGPDFPTSGIIYGKSGIKEAYSTGRGKIMIRARAKIEETKRADKEQIVITEIPYQVNKAKLLEDIATLVRDKRIEGISDIRDESDKDGMRVVIELKREALSEIILNQLYQNTQLQISYGIIMLALVNNQPKVITLREALELFISHRREIVTRRCVYDLKKAEERAHILLGLKIAIDNIDEVIALIRKAKDAETARLGLMKRFSITEIQSKAILDMKLERLTNLEREKIVLEYEEVVKLMEKLKEILSDERLVYEIIVQEMEEIKKKYGDERKTDIMSRVKEFTEEDLIAEEDMAVTVTHGGYIKRNPVTIYRSQRRGGKGKVGMGMKEEDFVEQLFVASTHSYLLILSNLGRIYWLKVYEVPEAGRAAKGKPIVTMVKMNQSKGEKIQAILSVKDFEEGKCIVMATKKGIIKKTDLMEFANPRPSGIIAVTIDDDDALISASIVSKGQDIFLASKKGKAIRFNEENVRSMGRNARGVIGFRMKSGDELVGMEVLAEDAAILTATSKGFGKRTPLEEYREQGRGGQGIITIKANERNGEVVGVAQVTDKDDIMIMTDKGKLIRLRGKSISEIGRNTQGVRLVNMDESERVASIAKVVEEDENGDE